MSVEPGNGVQLDVCPKRPTNFFQSTLKAGADGTEFPFAIFLVDLGNCQRGLNGKIFFQIKPQQGLSVVVGQVLQLDKTDIGVFHLAKVLLAFLCIVDRDADDNFFDLVRNFRKIDLDDLIVPSPFPVRLSPICTTAPPRALRLL